MNELRLGSKVQAWLDVMPREAPDRLMDAVIRETAGVAQVRPRFGLRGRGLRRPRALVALVGVGLLLLVAAVAFLLGAALPKQGPRVYLNQVLPSAPLAVARAHPFLVTLADGRVLVVGGSDTGPAGEIVDPGWGARLAVTEPAGGQKLRHAYAGALLPDGRVFVLAPGEAWAFDPGLASFVPLAEMTAPRDQAALAVLTDGRVLIAGGYALGDAGNSLASAELFDPSTGQFNATAGVMQWGRQQHVMVASPDGGALVFSGLTMVEGGHFGNSQVEEFDPGTGAFRDVFSSVDTRTIAVPLADGRIALFDAPEPYQVTGNVAIYDVAAHAATPTKPLPYVVNTAVLLHDGRILITGAERSGNLAGTFDPLSGSVVDAPRLGSWSASTVRLADGRVLLIGGYAAAEPSDDETAKPPSVPTVQIFQ